MNVLGIFAKRPVPGRVKTRLAKGTSPEFAAALYEAFLQELTDRLAEEGDRRVLAFTPDDASTRTWFESLANGRFELVPQAGTDLGDRMHTFFDQQFATGAGQVVLIGSDSPTLPAALIRDAFHALVERDVVIGPASDGGYYLVGQRNGAHDIFRATNWSSELVLQQTISCIETAGLSSGLLSPWYDVDTISSLQTLRGHMNALRVSEGIAFPAIERVLEEHPDVLSPPESPVDC